MHLFPWLSKPFSRIQSFKDFITDLLTQHKPGKSKNDEFIVCEHLVKIYKESDLEVFALQGLDLKIKKGELFGIIGSSGSGKSTLLQILGGLDKPTAGRVRVAGWDINRLSYRDQINYRRYCIGFVWQDITKNLVPYLNIRENILLPMIIAGRKPDNNWAIELLDAVGLGKKKHSKPIELSGGQQQRIAIAMALVNRPDIILADEPTGSLDSNTARDIYRVFKDITRIYNTTVVAVTHDRSLASTMDRVVEIRDGKISTESVRNQSLKVEDFNPELVEGFDAGETHDHYLVLDSAGRLQIPGEYIERLSIKDRVKARIEGEKIIILPDGPLADNEAEGS